MTAAAVELSRPLALEDLKAGPVEREFAATPGERAALARRFDLLGLDELRANVTVKRNLVGEVAVEGRLSARVQQACVVTLEPVAADVEDTFDLRFAPIDPDGHELPADDREPLPDGPLDLGEIVAEQLALSLDPYPRSPDAVLEAPVDDGARDAPIKQRPFAKLAALRAADDEA